MSDKFTILKDFINSVGFPIAMSIVLIYINFTIMENQNTVLKKLEQSITESKSAISENTRLVALLITQYEQECE